MNDLALRVDKVSKQYHIGERDSHQTLRDALARAAARPWQALRASTGEQRNRVTSRTFWALRDVSFEVKQGEVLGIIGRNGAGKSTLLKIVSRITEPTEGRVEGYGRLGSLLEVGTGFHPELTGRENIYLNGAILGMKKAEIDRKFDEIVAFSEVEQFLDTPVKRYSSGMYVRLAFAVAANLEPEILIVDEVLAVGDSAFQRKCLGKMDEVAKQGRTVLFVSHNMGLVQKLCNRAILLRYGKVAADDTAYNTVTAYLKMLEEADSENLLERSERGGEGKIKLAGIKILSEGVDTNQVLATGRPARFVFHLSDYRPAASCSFTIYDQLGQPVTFFDSALHSSEDLVGEQKTMLECLIDELTLLPGRYRINAAVTWNGELQDHLEGAAFFEVEQGKLRERPVANDPGSISILIPHRWITPDDHRGAL